MSIGNRITIVFKCVLNRLGAFSDDVVSNVSSASDDVVSNVSSAPICVVLSALSEAYGSSCVPLHFFVFVCFVLGAQGMILLQLTVSR